MRRMIAAMIMALALLAPQTALAVLPDEILDDPALESRARNLSQELRCMVCQNQSIDDSDAELARDLRLLVRERLVAGDSDQDVLDFIVARYGEFVLLRPVVAGHTIVLWIAAPVFLLVGLGFVIVGARRRRGLAAPPAALTEDEAKALEKLAQD